MGAQCDPVEDRGYCQERGRRNASGLVVEHKKATEAIRDDFGLAVLAQDHHIMAERFVARGGSRAAVAIKGSHRGLANHTLVNQGTARADEIAIGKLLQRRLAGLPLGKNRQREVRALYNTRSGHPHPREYSENIRSCENSATTR